MYMVGNILIIYYHTTWFHVQ